MTAYEKAIEKVEKERAHLEELRPAFELIEGIRDELYTGDSENYWRCRIEYRNDRPWIRLITNDVKEVIPIIRRIRASGIPLSNHYDVSNNGWRVYIMGDIHVIADISQGQGSCRLEQIGTREVPVYAIHCDEPDLHAELFEFDAVEVL